MPGLLTHLIASVIGFIAIGFLFKSYKYGLVFAIGQLIPDIIRFGVTGVVNKTLDFGEIISKPLFWTLSFTHYVSFWIAISALIFAVIFGIYKAKKINKKRFKKWIIADGIFLASIIIHLILDALIIEKSYWI